MAVSQHELIQSYRSLYKSLLRAVQYSKPSRYIVRDRLRNAFRNSNPEEFEPSRVARTIEFFHGASQSRGMEHKILKNLVHVQWGRNTPPRKTLLREDTAQARNAAYKEFDQTVEMLNESMGLCIK
ncbi:Hypothetical protein R9X50_00165500 [Acrodontium crateriforme]|uniref:DUF1763-domain-containing protein n=1 Tax=Acrodontium crateriforme TaxID=150365 RepID=A0AAQ3RA86_9PEZI|nr:Hypothetical protein R9X50_00165500 [Acrodontium crateriforme]